MSQEKDITTMFSEILEELHKLDSNQYEQFNLHELMSDVWAKLDLICHALEDCPEKIVAELNTMTDAKAMVELQKSVLVERVDGLEEKNKETTEKNTAMMDAQDKEYDEKVAELEAIEKECEHLRNRFEKKQAKIAQLHKLMNAEASQQEKQRQILNDLTSRYESKADKSRFLDEQKALQSESAELDELFNEKQVEIENLQEENAAKLKALEAVKIENSSKSKELTELRSRTDDIREKCKRKDNNNLKALSDFEAIEKQQKAQIEQMERQIAEEQAKYESAQKMNTDLIDRIKSEFGNDKSLDEMTTAAKDELEALDSDCAELNNSIDVICKLMQSNDLKLSALNEAKDDIFERLDRSMNITDELSENEDQEPSRQLSERGVSVETEIPEQKEEVFLLPRKTVRTKRRYEPMSLQQDQHEVPEEQAEPVVRSADSSVTEFGASALESLMEGPNAARDDHGRMKIFRDNYL